MAEAGKTVTQTGAGAHASSRGIGKPRNRNCDLNLV